MPLLGEALGNGTNHRPSIILSKEPGSWSIYTPIPDGLLLRAISKGLTSPEQPFMVLKVKPLETGTQMLESWK